MAWLKRLEGYRTYLTAASTLLLSLSGTIALVATFIGLVSPEYGVSAAAMCVLLSQGCAALAQMFQRIATSNATNIIHTLGAEIERLRRLLGGSDDPKPTPPAPVETVDFTMSVRPHASGMMLIALSLCLGGSACLAQDGVSIIGPTEVQAPGLPCELHLQGLDPLKTVAIAWKVFPPVTNVRMVEARDGGKVCRLTTIAGRWSVICTYHVEGEPIRFAEAHDVLVPGAPYVPAPGPLPPVPQPLPPAPVPTPQPPTPGPNVDPTPTPKPPLPPLPGPAPVLPAGEFENLPTRVRDLANAVTSPTKAAESAKLADALEGVAAQIAAGTLTGPQNIVNALGVSLNSNTSSAWDDCRTKMVDALKSLYMSGKLKTTAAWATLLREVVTGLRAVR